MRDLRSDITTIPNGRGAAVVTYCCKIPNVGGRLASTLGIQNPFRYRGYVYDQETGLYYLQTRYYDPELGRFISADDLSYLGAGGELLGCNLFAYCGNNPVNRTDPDGTDWQDVFAVGIIVAATGLIILATISTGGGALVLASVGIEAAAAASAANIAVAAGLTVSSVSLVQAAFNISTSASSPDSGDNRDNSSNGSSNRRTSANQMQEQVKRGQAPKEVKSVHKGNQNIPNNKDHIHFKDETALNCDGTASHEGNGIPQITGPISKWILGNNWCLPK